jgi:acyl-coenzyme A thioesterase PaaI-like protein
VDALVDTPLDFTTLTTPRQDGPGRFRVDIPDGWQQGRGAFGGLVVAVLARAAMLHEADGQRPLRSLTAELCAPALVGPADVQAETLRRGKHVSMAAARLLQEGEVVAHAACVFARARRDDWQWTGLAAPAGARSDWRSVPPVPPAVPVAPVFTQWCEFRSDGPAPFSGAARPDATGWIRFTHPGPVRDVAEVAALIDAWWPAHFPVERSPRPIATVSFTFDAVADVSTLDREAPLYHRGSVLAARDGYLVEQRELWSPAGELVAINTQTVAILG